MIKTFEQAIERGFKRVEYTYLYFILEDDDCDDIWWNCLTNEERDEVGFVEYSTSQDQYCFYPYGETEHDARGLRDIVDFLDRINKDD